MKTKNIVWVLLLFTLITSCKKTKELFDITFHFSTNNDFNLPKTADKVYNVPDSVITIKTGDITNTIPDEFKKNHADIDNLKSLIIEGINLTIKSPATQNFSFMKSIKVYLGAPGTTELLIATQDKINEINPSPTSLNLTVANADVVQYVKGPTYYLKIQTALVKTYTQDILVTSEIKFKAVANPLN